MENELVLGFLGSHMADTWPFGTCEAGLEMKMVHMEILREYYWPLPSWKVVKENGLVSGINSCLGALMRVPGVPAG